MIKKSSRRDQISFSALVAKNISNLNHDVNPLKTIASGKIMAKAWAKSLPVDAHLTYVQNFLKKTLSVYWQSVHSSTLQQIPLPELYSIIEPKKLDNSVLAVAQAIGRASGQLEVTEAAFQLGNLYTSMLPEKVRSSNGVFYTPPALTKRLIDMSTAAGVNWATSSVVDPACGGGAFLAPVAIKISEVLPHLCPLEFLNHIEDKLRGFEIDPFAAWLTQIFLEVSIKDRIQGAGRKLSSMITICNSLHVNVDRKFDLVIGNPPYGKIKLDACLREKYKAGLFGHANLYGLFTDLAMRLVKKNGVIGYLTPTSFLSGEYFKNLRQLILSQVNPFQLDFINIRKGVFEDVLQETVLATYKMAPEGKIQKVIANEIIAKNDIIQINHLGAFKLPKIISAPWIVPRTSVQSAVIPAMDLMKNRLGDWNYKVCTGQLVWNRHKSQLDDYDQKSSYPVIWAESILQNGTFQLKAAKKNHSKWFHFNEGQEYLLTKQPCILLQRTTSKEQQKRLIATVLPQELIEKKFAVVIENHINMIVPSGNPAVSMEVLSVFLNSEAVNRAFRTISGSVAVSAYELEALPLPDPKYMIELTRLVNSKSSEIFIEQECYKLYSTVC